MQEQQHSSDQPDADMFSVPSKPRGGRNSARRLFVGATAGVVGLAIGVMVGGLGMLSGPRATAAERTGNGPAVVELFTSQGCYSCPPAEKLLGELIENDPELVALEFHVDYWDSLVYGSHGSHKDPFSDSDNSLRQREYDQADLQGQRGVYTPQMVINGQYAAVGSKGALVREGIEVLDRPVVELSVEHEPALDTTSGGTGLHIRLGDHSRAPDNAHLWLAVFDIEKTTEITTGENHDKSLTSHHIVREFSRLTPVGGLAKLTSIEEHPGSSHQVELKEGQGCAVLLQDSSLGPVYGAAYCPRSLWGVPG